MITQNFLHAISMLLSFTTVLNFSQRNHISRSLNAFQVGAHSQSTSINPTLNAEKELGTQAYQEKVKLTWDLALQSPCKINLFLRILGRRPTGYHDLASLFQAISLSDYMYFKKLESSSATKDILTCSDKTLSVDGNNLVVKALNLMRNKTGIQQYFQVHLDKVVPIQAGLGGGSGNAATAMHAFNALCGFPGSLNDLRQWSGDIGSDITFFFTSGTAYCTGRGEIVASMKALPSAHETVVHVFKPKEGLSTPLVFKTLNLNKTSSLSPEDLLQSYLIQGALVAAESGLLINDLEPPSFTCEPLLDVIKKEILKQKSGIAGSMMSGSGTSIYALEKVAAISSTTVTAPPPTPRSFNPQLVLDAFPGVRHFECRFLNKLDDIHSWYQ